MQFPSFRQLLLSIFLVMSLALSACSDDDDDDTSSGSTPPPSSSTDNRVSGTVATTPSSTTTASANSVGAPWYARIVEFVSPAWAVPEGLEPVVPDSLNIQVWNAGTGAYEALDAPAGLLEEAITINDDGTYAVDFTDLIAGDYVPRAVYNQCIIEVVIPLPGGGTQTIRAPVVLSELDLTPFSEFLVQTLEENGVDFDDLDEAELAGILEEIEEVNVDLDGGLEQVLENLQVQVGDVVAEDLENSQLPEPSDDDVSGLLGGYNFIGLTHGQSGFNNRDEFTYGDYYFYTEALTMNISAGGEEDKVQVSIPEAALGETDIFYPGGVLDVHFEEETENESFTATVLGGGGFSFAFPSEQEAVDFDGNEETGEFEVCSPVLFTLRPLGELLVATATEGCNIYEEVENGGAPDLSQAALGRDKDLTLALMAKQSELTTNDFMKPLGVVGYGIEAGDGGELLVKANVFHGAYQAGTDTFKLTGDDTEIVRNSGDQSLVEDTETIDCDDESSDGCIHLKVDLSDTAAAGVGQIDLQAGDDAEGPFESLGFRGFASAGGKLLAALDMSAGCDEEEGEQSRESNVGCVDDPVSEFDSTAATYQLTGIQLAVPLAATAPTLGNLAGKKFKLVGFETGFDDPESGDFRDVAFEMCRGFVLEFTAEGGLIESAPSPGETCTWVRKFADDQVPEVGSDTEVDEPSEIGGVTVTVDENGKITITIVEDEDGESALATLEGFMSEDGNMLIMRYLETVDETFTFEEEEFHSVQEYVGLMVGAALPADPAP